MDDRNSGAAPQLEKLHLSTKLAYGAGDLGPAITANILVFYLLFFFTQVAGLPAGLAGSILMVGKIADAINDPVVGFLSDRTRSPWGRRLPWMLAGTLPFGLIYCLQWAVPHFSDDRGLNNGCLFAYYVAIGILFNLAFTAVNLPYTALTPELTQDYNERTKLNSFRFAFSIGGSILSLILYVLISRAYPDRPQDQFWLLGLICAGIATLALLWCALGIQERGRVPLLDPGQKKRLGTVAIAVGVAAGGYGLLRGLASQADWLSLLAVLLSLLGILAGLTFLRASPEPHLLGEGGGPSSAAQAVPSLSFPEQLQVAFSNRPFLYVIGIYLCSWMAVQLTASILVFFVVSWMQLPEAKSGLVALAVQGTALVMLFFWQGVSQKRDKKTVYCLGMGFWIAAQIGLFSLQPHQEGWMYFLAVVAGFGVSVAYLIPWSMLPDAIELDELRTGQRREGVFYAFMVLLQKFGLAAGLFLVGIVLQAAGFVERVPGEPIPPQPASALWAIRLAIGPLPTLFLIGGMVLTYFYPLSREVHAQIRLQLQERSAAGGFGDLKD